MKNKPQQDVTEGTNIVLDLVPEVALADNHPGEKGADRRGETREMHREGRAEGEEHHREKEKVGRVRARHPGESDAEYRPGDENGQSEREGSEGEVAQDRCSIGRPRAHHDQEGDRREILEQQDPHRQPAMLAAELVLVGELLQRDRRRRHRRRTAEHDGGGPGHCEQRRDPRHHERSDADLEAPGAEHVPARGDHGGERELEPDHEHQEDDAELGEEPGLVAGGEEVQPMGPDNEAGA